MRKVSLRNSLLLIGAGEEPSQKNQVNGPPMRRTILRGNTVLMWTATDGIDNGAVIVEGTATTAGIAVTAGVTVITGVSIAITTC